MYGTLCLLHFFFNLYFPSYQTTLLAISRRIAELQHSYSAVRFRTRVQPQEMTQTLGIRSEADPLHNETCSHFPSRDRSISGQAQSHEKSRVLLSRFPNRIPPPASPASLHFFPSLQRCPAEMCLTISPFAI